MRLAWSLTPAPLPFGRFPDDHRAFTADVLLTSRYWLIDSADAMAEQQLGLRERLGISYGSGCAALGYVCTCVPRIVYCTEAIANIGHMLQKLGFFTIHQPTSEIY